MKIKYLLSVIAIVAITKDSFAQYSQDAIRFSTFQTGSTSRIKGIGNAGTAIGGDLSSISGNPAGLGFFTHSEASITPEFDGSKVNSTYLGQFNTDSKSNLNFSNASVVIYQRLSTPKGRDKTKGWLSINYGAAYSRTNNFYENITYGGKNPTNSIGDYYAGIANANGQVSDGGLDDWAYQQNLIDSYATTGGGSEYRRNAFGTVNQLSNTIRTGGQSEVNLAFGANYSNKLYFGLGVSFSDIRYNSYNVFNETGTANILVNNVGTDVGFNSNFIQDQVTKGSGANVKLGVIYKPVNALRLGFTFTSPTYYTIDDSYSEGLNTNFANNSGFKNGPVEYPLSYNMRTPLKLTGGAAIFIGKYGFISGDVDYIDYTTTHISSTDSYSADFDNGNIKALYRSTINAHIGAEARLNSMFYLRGGYGIQGSPLKTNGSDIKTISGGVGVRFGNYYVDATYAHLSGNQTVYPYEIGTGSPGADLKKTNNNAFLTLGYAF
ncbi:OmpP1/FadL family transporter [Mucilaginibacter ginsenosidivorax]|uniref:Uncharacterized protein n=1 Tax=Mucilaginibacter ginsenosidivorax TaxID=862126 RepID=A0A5B8W447_9SPHI|nr:hypothetical protein [Mucilaginibacter ginsenosidivorax]QEC78503.1 hypothetical protein FSB76_22065 [Mucilaginibacter ginsenosidivorax]